MPTYEYFCDQCGKIFEKFKPMSAPSREKCPECGNKSERLIGAGAGMIIRGDHGSRPSNGTRPGCGRETTCCGRDEPCGDAPCGH